MSAASSGFPTLAVGGGCHWCTEGVFVSLAGVERVEQGWITAAPPDDAESEGVIIHYNPGRIDREQLLAVHLETHAATASHPMRGKYRSAVYVRNSEEEAAIRDFLSRWENEFGVSLVTRVLPFTGFRLNDESFLDYYRRRPDAPFCQRYIVPKLERLRAERPGLFNL